MLADEICMQISRFFHKKTKMLNCMQNVTQGYSLEEVIMDVLDDERIPILYGFPTGHTSRPNVLVPFGIRTRLTLGADSVFEMLEPAVAGK